MTNTNESLAPHEELSQWETKLIRKAAFKSSVDILDMSFEDKRLNDLVDEYEEARRALLTAAFAVANYCNLDSHGE